MRSSLGFLSMIMQNILLMKKLKKRKRKGANIRKMGDLLSLKLMILKRLN